MYVFSSAYSTSCRSESLQCKAAVPSRMWLSWGEGSVSISPEGITTDTFCLLNDSLDTNYAIRRCNIPSLKQLTATFTDFKIFTVFTLRLIVKGQNYRLVNYCTFIYLFVWSFRYLNWNSEIYLKVYVRWSPSPYKCRWKPTVPLYPGTVTCCILIYCILYTFVTVEVLVINCGLNWTVSSEL